MNLQNTVNMKKVITLTLLLFSTSLLMAQFGDLKELIKKSEANKNEGTNAVNEIKENALELQFIEKAVVQGLVTIKQDFQLKDTITEKFYNFGGDPNRFGGQTSFLVKLDNGFVIPDEILHPWDYDPNYTEFKNKQYVPFFNRTSLLRVSQGNWKELEIPFGPVEKAELANGLKYVRDEKMTSNGFYRFSGYGKKEVWIVWLLISDDNATSGTHCEFVTKKTEMVLEKGSKLYKMEAPESKLKTLGGIVVEPVFNGVGRIDFALVGVIAKTDGEYNMALIEPNMADEVLISEGSNIENLTPSEAVEKVPE